MARSPRAATGDRPRLPRGAGLALVLVALVVAGWLLVRWLGSSGTSPKRNVPEVVQLKLIQPPAPPPPPPPPPEKPKIEEAPRMKEAMRTDTPPPARPPAADPRPAPPSAAPPALDAQGEAGSDAFGLGGKPGGGDFIGGGGGGPGGAGGVGGDAFGWYAALIQGHVRNQLQRRRDLLGARYRIGVEVWLNAQGRPERVELIDSTGQPAIDQGIREALMAMPPTAQLPPPNLPQPVVLRVASS